MPFDGIVQGYYEDKITQPARSVWKEPWTTEGISANVDPPAQSGGPSRPSYRPVAPS